jgi:hypothetical protein
MTVATEAVAWTAVNVLLCAAAYVASPRIFKQPGGNPHTRADLISSTPVFVLLAYYAIANTLELRGSVADRWAGVTEAGTSFFVLYIVRQTFSFPFVFLSGLGARDKALMTVHHLLSICAYATMLVTQRMHFYGTLLGMSEISTCFLNAMLILKGLQREASALFVLNGLCLWVTYLVFRMALFPGCLWLFAGDARSDPAGTIDRLTAGEKWGYLGSAVVLLAMSTKWFIGVTKGMLKVLLKTRKLPKQQKQQKQQQRQQKLKQKKQQKQAAEVVGPPSVAVVPHSEIRRRSSTNYTPSQSLWPERSTLS